MGHGPLGHQGFCGSQGGPSHTTAFGGQVAADQQQTHTALRQRRQQLLGGQDVATYGSGARRGGALRRQSQDLRRTGMSRDPDGCPCRPRSTSERKITMGSKTNQANKGIALQLIDQHKVRKNMAIAKAFPISFELMISESKRELTTKDEALDCFSKTAIEL